MIDTAHISSFQTVLQLFAMFFIRFLPLRLRGRLVLEAFENFWDAETADNMDEESDMSSEDNGHWIGPNIIFYQGNPININLHYSLSQCLGGPNIYIYIIYYISHQALQNVMFSDLPQQIQKFIGLGGDQAGRNCLFYYVPILFI